MPFRTLELFAGTQSFTKGVKRAHPAPGQAHALTVDILPKFQPRLMCSSGITQYSHQGTLTSFGARPLAPNTRPQNPEASGT